MRPLGHGIWRPEQKVSGLYPLIILYSVIIGAANYFRDVEHHKLFKPNLIIKKKLFQ